MPTNRTNKIASNTLFLYARSFITMCLGLYTSRIMLNTLGVDDYGLYNVVGGVVGMFASLKVVFASSIQRFLNFEKGKGDVGNPIAVFNLSLIIQSGLALIFFLLVELMGLEYLLPKLSLSENFSTAVFIFHCSLCSAIIGMLATPFDAVIIANECMVYFGTINIIDAVLKCLGVLVLPIIGFQYVKTYAVIILLISILNLLVSIIYCMRFEECHIRRVFDKQLFRELVSFSGWNFFGNSAFTLVNEGLNIILNVFGGVAVNAARSIAYQVKSAISTLNNNLLVAVQPFVVQQSVTQDKKVLFNYIYRITRLSFMLILLITFPIIVFADYILDIWLVEVPSYSVGFVQLVLIHVIIRSHHAPIDLLFKAFGKIKQYQLIDAITLAISIPVGYLCLMCGCKYWTVFLVVCLVEIINLICILICAKFVVGLSLFEYLNQVIKTTLLTFCIFTIFGYSCVYLLRPSSLNVVVIQIIFVVALEIILVYLLSTKQDKTLLSRLLNKRRTAIR